MKKLILLSLLVLCSVSCKNSLVVTLYAQTLPVTKTAAWNANAAGDGITAYNLKLDGAAVTLSTPTSLNGQVTFTTAGAHVLTLSATNQWGTSSNATLNVNVVVPGQPTGFGLQ